MAFSILEEKREASFFKTILAFIKYSKAFSCVSPFVGPLSVLLPQCFVWGQAREVVEQLWKTANRWMIEAKWKQPLSGEFYIQMSVRLGSIATNHIWMNGPVENGKISITFGLQISALASQLIFYKNWTWAVAFLVTFVHIFVMVSIMSLIPVSTLSTKGPSLYGLITTTQNESQSDYDMRWRAKVVKVEQ